MSTAENTNKKISKFSILRLISAWRQILDIESDTDKQQTVINILKNKKVEGANAWMLICSIVIASLGLDLNSAAVIIGAMLISPLMSPILGVGLSIAINDKVSLKDSAKHFTISVIIALLTSTLYFLLSPYEANTTPEILARTKPTFLDVLVAFFGGVAGIISGSRKDASNAIPGVAIATALMPPLCVTGFGLANLANPEVSNAFQITINSFYLFFLNSTFIAFATWLIVRMLKFPYVTFMDSKERRNTTLFVFGISLALIIPSFFIFGSVIRDLRLDRQVAAYVREVFEDQSEFIDEYQTFQQLGGETENKLIIKVYGTLDRFKSSEYYNGRLEDFGIDNMTVEVIPSSNFDLNKLRQMEAQINNVDEFLDKQLGEVQTLSSKKDSLIKTLEEEVIELGGGKVISGPILKKVKEKYPDIVQIGFSNYEMNNFKDSTLSILPIVIVKWADKKSAREIQRDNSEIKELLEFNVDKIDGLKVINHPG